MNLNGYNELPELIPDNIIERVKKLNPAQLCDGMQKLGILRNGCMDKELMPIDPDKVMLGTAYTVDTENGDNFPIHVAIYQGKPGYVLVVSGKGYTDRTYLGDLMGGAAAAIGLDGVIIDGCVRDKKGLKELDIPVYAKGIMQRSPVKKGPGKINVPVFCAGVNVVPGDLVFGDADGVTVVPRDQILQVIELAENKNAYEIKRYQVIKEYAQCRKNNKPLPQIAPEWVLEMLSK